jgi:hypothetical protein
MLAFASSIHNKQQRNPVCERRVNLLVYSFSLHRHSYIGFILAFASLIHNNKRNRTSLFDTFLMMCQSTSDLSL